MKYSIFLYSVWKTDRQAVHLLNQFNLLTIPIFSDNSITDGELRLTNFHYYNYIVIQAFFTTAE